MNLIQKTLIVVAVTLATFQAKAENLALVLSFENYENGADVRRGLSNHDALLAAYRDAGYQTFGGRDRSHSQLRRLLRNFVTALPGADNAVIHITGHVATFGSESWVLPSDTDADTVGDLEIDGISVDFLLQLLAQKPGHSVMFLGMADRNFDNITGARRGVANNQAPDGVLMVSGAHNDVSRAVLNNFIKSSQSIVEALAANRHRLTIDGDIPFGLVLAEDVAPRVATAADIEAALGLSRNQRRAIQADLAILGYNLGSIDGVFGNATRRAVRNWQERERLDATGYLTRAQVRRLDQQAAAARREIEGDDRAYWARTGASGTAGGLRNYLERYPEGLFATRAQNELAVLEQSDDVTEWERAANRNNLAGYQRYLERYPDGIYNRLAKVRIQEILSNQPDPNEDARRVEDRLRLDEPSRLLIELRLAGLGYRVGSADGNFDNSTRRAIRSYQNDHDLPETGYVTSGMIRLLLLGR